MKRHDPRPMKRVVHLPAPRPSGRADTLAWPSSPEAEAAHDLKDFWEFLAADFDPAYAVDVPAAAGDAARRPRSSGPDPAFRERLREQLWRLVKRRQAMAARDHRDPDRSH